MDKIVISTGDQVKSFINVPGVNQDTPTDVYNAAASEFITEYNAGKLRIDAWYNKDTGKLVIAFK